MWITLFFLSAINISVFSQLEDLHSGILIESNHPDTLFYDGFDAFTNYWLLGMEEGSWTETIEDGKLYFQSHSDHPKEDLIPVFIDTRRDFEIETSLQFLRGDLSRAYGLQWGKSKTGSGQYDFFLAANGQFTIDKYDGKFEDYVPFTPSPHVNRVAPNKLTIRKIADSTFFFLNDHPVHRMPFRPFFGNLIGFQVPGNSTILVDYLMISYLDRVENPLSKVLIIDYSFQQEAKTALRGMPVAMKVQLKNAGNRDATDLDIQYHLPGGIEVIDFESVSHLPAGGTAEMTLSFFAREEYRGDSIPVRFDIRGADITNAGDVDFTHWLNRPVREAPDKALLQTYSEYRGEDPLKGLNIAQALRDIEVGEYHALIIGIDDFRGEWSPLRNAVNDARALEQVLKQRYQFDHITTLFNERATRRNILGVFEQLMSELDEEDNLLIYYSGHGYYNERMQKGFWVPVDADSKQLHQYISNEEIRSFISGIPSRHTLLITDACFAGDILRGKKLTIPHDNSTKYYHKVYSLNSRKALTSGGTEPVQDGGRDGHSVFGYYLLKSLESNDKKYLDAGELFNMIRIPVINNSEQTPEYNAVHRTGDEGGQFVFISKIPDE